MRVSILSSPEKRERVIAVNGTERLERTTLHQLDALSDHALTRAVRHEVDSAMVLWT